MITYNDIYEAARKERYSDQLQPIAKKFIQDVSSYFVEKEKIASKTGDDFSESNIKTNKQIENARTLFKELMLRRRRKILDLVLIAAETGISKQDFENMLLLEKELFEGIMKCIEEGDKKVKGLLNGGQEIEKKNQMIVFKGAVEEFVDLMGNKLGPFEKGQIANIPREVVKILVDSGKAESVEE